MLPAAVVRYLIVCDDFEIARKEPFKTNLYGLLTSLGFSSKLSYPLRIDQLCVYVALTEARGNSRVKIQCVTRPEGEITFSSPSYELEFENDPLQVIALPFRLRDCPFPHPGQYAVQFLYNEVILDERLLQLK